MLGRLEEPIPASTGTKRNRLLAGGQAPVRVLKHRPQIPASLVPHTHGHNLLGGNTWGTQAYVSQGTSLQGPPSHKVPSEPHWGQGKATLLLMSPCLPA